MTARTRYFVISSLLVLFVGLGSGLVAYFGGAGALTSRGGPDELQYLPADASVVAYADVRSIMSSELRQRFLRAAPGQQTGQHDLEQLTGINVETDIDHVVACMQNDSSGGNGSGLVLATGLFNEAKIEALMREHGAQTEEYGGKRIVIAPKPLSPPPSDPSIPNPDSFRQPHEFALSFLKPGLVALGTPNLIRRAIDLQAGGANLTTNEEVMNLVRSIDSGNAWAVGRFDALRNSARLPAGVNNQLPPISLFSVSAQINDGISGVLRADTATDEAAKNLRDVVQGFLALARLQIGSKPELQGVVDSLQISGTGKTVALTFSVPVRVIDLLAPATAQPERQAH